MCCLSEIGLRRREELWRVDLFTEGMLPLSVGLSFPLLWNSGASLSVFLLLCLKMENFIKTVSRTCLLPHKFIKNKHTCSRITFFLFYWLTYLCLSTIMNLLPCFYLSYSACQSKCSPMVIYECGEITVELIFPMIAYLNRMYGDISLRKDMGIIFALETFVSLQRCP